MSEDSDSETGKKPELGPNTVLDSVFHDDGPMPTAKLRMRGLAFILDIILVTAVASVIIWKVVMPQMHPGALHEFLVWSEELFEWWGLAEGAKPSTPPEASAELVRALTLANELQLLVAWIYFAFGEAFFGGSSLGKRICRLRSVSTITLGPPQFMSGIVRGGMKTIILFWLFPILFLANFVSLFFNKRRQLGHDWLSKTVVVDEKYLEQKESR